MHITNRSTYNINTWILVILLFSSMSINAEPQRLQQMADEFKQRERIEKTEAIEFAQRIGIPIREEFSNGQVIEIQKIENGIPLFYTTNNEKAAITTRTNFLWSFPFSVTGSGYDRLGVWDGGAVRGTHDELTGRVTQVDGATTLSNHSTHVAGTLIASGVDSTAQGMAYQATLLAYDFNSDNFEMTTAALNGMEISNHSYGFVTGWNGSDEWYGDTSISQNEAYRFGFYDTKSKDWDNIAYNAPNYLIVKAAGNDRNDAAPSPGTAHSHNNGNGTFTDNHNSDGFDNGGYDTISSGSASAKNILTIGAVSNVANYNSPNDVSMSSFSGWGPVDDGRIKPDIVGDGVAVKSSIATNDSAYAPSSGTSMASPNVAGTLALLQQYYGNTHNNNSMRSATLKALVIHTADETGISTGPDYQYGWGLLNANSAAEKIEEDPIINTIDEQTLPNNGTYARNVVIGGNRAFKVTIVWTDPAGTPVSASLDPSNKMLVNDLDLRVTNNGTTYYPWSLNKNSPSSAATNNGPNNIDNVEQVYIANPSAGTYTITVDHNGTLTSNQNFSIIISEDQLQTDDNYEENDTLASAYSISNNEQTWLNTIDGYGIQSDDDWYKIYVNTGFERVNIDLQFTHANGDIDLKLYDASGAQLAISQTTNDNEYIDYTVSQGNTFYYIKVYYGNNDNSYNLWWDDISTSSSLDIDLEPYTPNGWTYPVVIRTDGNCSLSSCSPSNTFTTQDDIYVNWAVFNSGTNDVSGTFISQIYIDNIERVYSSPDNLQANFFSYVNNYNLGQLSSGTHTMRLKADSTSIITESDESNNEYSFNFTVSAIAPPSPSTPNATDGAYNDKVRVTWSNVSGATTYKIYRCTTSSTNSCTYLGSDPSSPYDDTGGTTGVTYYYRIKASTNGLDSGYSNYDTGFRLANSSGLIFRDGFESGI